MRFGGHPWEVCRAMAGRYDIKGRKYWDGPIGLKLYVETKLVNNFEYPKLPNSPVESTKPSDEVIN